MVMIDDTTQWQLDRFVEAGLVISFVYGKYGVNEPTCWTVMVWKYKKEIFDNPFAGESFEHCLEIAVKECEERKLLNLIKRLHG